MPDAVTRENLLRPARPSAETKAEITNSTARAILKAEADRRDAKTEKLRQKRLEMEARQAPPAPVKKKTVRKRKISPSAGAA
jgi:hypothetical protein